MTNYLATRLLLLSLATLACAFEDRPLTLSSRISKADQDAFYRSLPFLNLAEEAGSSQRSHLRQSATPSTKKRRRLQESTLSDYTEEILNTKAKNATDDGNHIVISVTIEGNVPARFFCSSCRDELELQQAGILENLTLSYHRVELITAIQKLKNALFVRIWTTLPNNTSNSLIVARNSVHQFVGRIQGVKRVFRQEFYAMHQVGQTGVDAAIEYLGGDKTLSQFCVTGKSVRIAVLDSGIDYTHLLVGGPGTIEAYQEAYGFDTNAMQHTVVEEVSGLFPTQVVVDGKDFLGENYIEDNESPESNALPDNDPVDSSLGHGTAVAHAILLVAPKAELFALKVCSTISGTCPDFAVSQALEYALDPNGDGSIDDRVDIINLSLGLMWFSPYYDLISKMLEDM
jgi:Subtilase family